MHPAVRPARRAAGARRTSNKPPRRWASIADITSGTFATRPPLTPEDEETLKAKIQKSYGYDPRAFQYEGIKAQLEGTDTVIQASTGAGKTMIAAGPHLHPSAAGKITIMVEPLIALQTEMVSWMSCL